MVEAGLCLPKLRTDGRSRHDEHRAHAHLPVDPWSALVSVLLVLATAGFCLWPGGGAATARRSGCWNCCGSCWSRWPSLMLNQPEIDRGVPAGGKAVGRRAVGRLAQHGDTRCRCGAAAGHGPATRREAIAAADRGGVLEAHCASDSTWSSSRSARRTPVAAATCTSRWPRPRKRSRIWSASCCVSDGDWNEGPPPVQAARSCGLKGVPVFAVPVGSPTRLPDVELLSLDAPTFGVAGKSVRIPFTIESSLPRDYVDDRRAAHLGR